MAAGTIMHWLLLSKSTYYYKPSNGQRGRKPSTHTSFKGDLVSNDVVVDSIRSIISTPYNTYGYQMVSCELRDEGYYINPKKVYRLMDEHKLLLGKVIRSKGKRSWVQYRKIEAQQPMEYLCLDIKYVWVQGEGRWYYLLSIMDVYSRKIIHWIFQKSVKQLDVISMFQWIHTVYDLKGVIIRNDNGSQFLANQVRNYLQHLEAKQEFTHVATPEENAYIEAFHSILQRELIDKYEFSSYYEAKEHMIKYMQWYNYERKHKKLGRITPHQKWQTSFSILTDKQREKVDELGMSRPNDTIKNQNNNHSLVTSLDLADSSTYFCLEVGLEKHPSLQNHLNNTVQVLGG
ncbi:MAG: IS3 family transposase [Cytophagaceae bacterium]